MLEKIKIMAKISENKIPDIYADWGNDSSNGLPYSGEAVQEFIKETFKQKYGCFHYDENNNRYLVFADTHSRDLYFEDTEANKELLLSFFDAPFNYSANIELITDSYNAVLIGTVGNNLQFKFSIEDKAGNNTGENVDCIITLLNNGVKKTINKVYTFQQGRDGVLIELDNDLSEGTNNITITIKGQNTLAATTASIVYQVINLQLSDNMNISNVYNIGDVLPITFTVNGYGTKTMEWFLDGEQLPIESDIDEIFSNSEVTNNKFINLDKVTPGVHSIQFRVYTIVDGQKFYSNTLFRNFLVKGLDSTIIGVATELPIGVEPIKNNILTQLYGITRYVPYKLRYAIYNPTDSATNSVNVYINKDLQLTSNAVNNRENVASIVVNDFGEVYIKLEVNGSEYKIPTNVAISTIDVAEISSNLILDLRAFGRDKDSGDKDSGNRDSWVYGDYSAEFDGFYWNSQSGWVDNTLIINSGATVSINCSPLNPNPIDTGKTLEFEFATRNVISNDSVVLDLTTDEGVGLLITASEAKLIASDKSEVSTKFRAGENNRIAFVINMNENTTNACLMFIYVNGVLCGAARFSTAANLKCNKTIVFNSDSDILLKHLRFYDRALSSDEILNNYILYRDSISEMLNVYNRNDIYENGTQTISPEKLLNSIPVMYITCLDKDRGIPFLESRFDEEAKDENIYCDIEYKNSDSSKNFKIDYARVRIQGTSSIKYPRKNYRFYTNKETETVLYDSDGKVVPDRKYAFKENSIPVDCWCLKADYAESSGAHNTGVARIWNDLLFNTVIDGEYKLRTKAQQSAIDNNYLFDVRTCIDGFPIVVFYRMSYNDPWIFLGKYNFNNDKSTENVFGFEDIPGFDNSRMQCWEVLNNGHALCNFTEYSSEYFDRNWQNAFEARYPDKGDKAYTGDLKAFCEWIYSTRNNIEKFKEEKWQHLDVYKMAAYYIYVMRFGAVDQTVKNSMFTSEDGEKFYFINYDNDTILGLKNDGQLLYSPDVDRQSKDPYFTDSDDDVWVFAGHDSVLWNNMEADDEFMSIVKVVDKALYSAGLTYDNLINIFEDEQTSKWCERVYNRDAQYKYISPDNGRLLSLQGPRNAHRRWWLSERFNIYDAKFVTGDFRNRVITMNLEGAKIGDNFKITAGKELPFGWSVVNGVEEITPVLKINEDYTFYLQNNLAVGDPVSIFGANNILELDLSNIASNLSNLDLSGASSDFSPAIIKRLIMSGENTALKNFKGVNSLTKLEHLDIQGQRTINSLNINNLINLKTLLAKNSGLTSIDLAPGCLIERLELPKSIEVLTLTDLPLLTANNLVLDGDWTKVKEINISGCPNLTNDFELIWNWYNKTSSIDSRILILYDVDWKNVNLDQLIELGQNIKNIILKGTIKLSNVDDKNKLLILKNCFGDNIFNSESDLHIYGPDAVYLFGPERILEGDPYQFETIIFFEEKGTLSFQLNPYEEERSGVYINNNGWLTTIENGEPSAVYQVGAMYRTSIENWKIDYTDVIVEKRMYPSSVSINANKLDDTTTEYTWSSPTHNITGKYVSEWTLSGDILNYVKIQSQTPDKCVIVRTSIPDFLATGQLKLTLIKDVDKSIIVETTLSVTEVNPNIIMTFETNPEVLSILYNAGLCASNTYMLKDEARVITNEDLYVDLTHSIFSNKNITKFNEFKYFTGVTTLQNGCFNGTKLNSIELPNSITKIEMNALGNTKLEYIYIPSSVNNINIDAFYQSHSLKWIDVEESNSYYISNNGCVYRISTNSELCFIPPALTDYIMPTFSKTILNEHVLKNAFNLETITFHKDVIEIKGSWFMYGSNYLNNIFGPDDSLLFNYYNGCVYNKDCTELIYWPCKKTYSEDMLHKNVIKFRDYAFVQNTTLGEFIIPDNVVNLGVWTFYKTSATKFVIHSNVSSIGSMCFSYNEFLKTVEMNSPNLGESCFIGCKLLNNISLSNNVSNLPANTFSGCRELTSIKIPANVKYIGNNCFSGCRLLGDIISLPTTAPSLGSTVFGSTFDTSLNATDGTYIGCGTAIKTLYIPEQSSGYDSGDWKTVLQDIIGFTVSG